MANLDTGYAAGGAAKTYTTLAAAFAACDGVGGDNAQVYYSDAAQNRYWAENVSASTTSGMSIEGMLDNRQVTFVSPGSDFYDLTGDLSGISTQLVFQNFSLLSATIGFRWNDTTGGGAGMRVTNIFACCYSRGVYADAGDSNVVQVDNSCFFGGNYGIDITMVAKIYYNTCVGAALFGIDNGNTASTLTNNLCAWNGTDYGSLTNSTTTYCMSSDDTADDNGGAGNLVDKNTAAEVGLWSDNNNSSYGFDGRIVSSSDAYQAGTPVGGITTDCDGNSRDGTNPSVGWHEGTSVAYPATGAAPTFSGITSLTDNADGTLTASWDAATGTCDHYEVHVHTSAPTGGDMDAHTYSVASADFGTNTTRIIAVAGAGKLAAGTTYHAAVSAWNGATRDTNSATLSTAVTNPNAAGGPHITIDSTAPVQLGTGETTIYTCPSTKRALVQVHLCNTDSSARTATLYAYNSGDAAAADTTALSAYSLAASGGVGHTWDSHIISLEASGTITGLASVASKVTAKCAVLEYTIE